MAVLDELFPASWRGVPFLTRERTLEAGRKTVTHEFPGADKRYVEDLGRLNRTFNLTGIISEPNYSRKRDNLRAALDKAGTGILVHPSFGSTRVASTTYTLTESDAELGVATFNMSFQVTEEIIAPSLTDNVLPLIDAQSDAALSALSSNIANNFGLSRQFADNFISASNQLNNVSSVFSDQSRKVASIPDNLNSFNSLVIDFQDEINNLILQPIELGNAFVDLFNSGNSLVASNVDAFNFFTGMFSFGSDDIEIVPNTARRIQQIKNQEVINASMTGGSLVQSYRNAVLLNYPNEIVLNDTREILENQYQNVSLASGFSQEYLDSISDIRDQVRFFFDKEQLNVKKVIQISVSTPTPATKIVYQYYGNLDNYDQIVSLNPRQNPVFFSGNISILTD